MLGAVARVANIQLRRRNLTPRHAAHRDSAKFLPAGSVIRHDHSDADRRALALEVELAAGSIGKFRFNKTISLCCNEYLS
jgi:hypothetical protein